MAFNSSNFVYAGPSPGSIQFTNGTGNAIQISGFIWNYTTTDSISDIDVSGYFNGSSVRPSDRIFVTASDGYAIYDVYQSWGAPTNVSIYKLAAFSSTPST